MTRQQARYTASLLAATAMMASSFIAGKVLLATGIPPFLLLGARFVLATLATLPFIPLDGPGFWARLCPPKFGLRNWITLALIGVVQTGGLMGLLFLGLRTITPSTAAILVFTNPIWVAVAGVFVLGERLTTARVAGLACGVVGVAFALGIGHFSDEPLAGKLFTFGGALCFATATVATKRAALPIGIWAFSFWQMGAGALVLLVLALVQGGSWPPFSLADWAWFVWLAIGSSTLVFGLWYDALRQGGATRTSGYLFLVPLFTVGMSAAILGAPLSPTQAIGGVLICIGLWLVNRPVRPVATAQPS